MTRLGTFMAAALLTASTIAQAASETWTVPNAWGNGSYTRAGDFHGDGRTDIFTIGGAAAGIYYSNGQNAFSGVLTRCWPTTPPPPLGNPEWVKVGNFDGTGADEYVSPSGGTAYIYSFNLGYVYPPGQAPCPEGFNAVPINSSWGTAPYTWVGDFNGDGYADIASQYYSDVYMKFGNASVKTAGFSAATWTISGPWGQAAYTKAGDFNGDGKTDIASMAGGNAYMKLSTGSGFVSVTWPISNLWFQGAYTFAGDFNGDGLDDIASCGGNTCYIKQSTGNGFIDPGNVTIDPSWGNAEWTFVGDFEGDGNDDIASAYYGSVFMKLVSP